MDEVSQKVEALNAALSASGQPFELALYDPFDLQLLEENARYMTNDKFAALVANIKRDGGLASVPLVYAFENPAHPPVLSGNHRVMAAREATGHKPILCLAIREAKTLDEQVAIQLSHNAICGADDLQTLKKLYDKISAIDWKTYSGLDEDTIKKLDAIKFQPISEPRLVFKTVTMLFLPSEQEELLAMLAHVEKLLESEDAFAFQVRDYQAFFDMLAGAKEGLKIKNSATAMLELMRYGYRAIQEQCSTAAADAAEPEPAIADEEPLPEQNGDGLWIRPTRQ